MEQAMHFPADQELRMLRSIAAGALLEAYRTGYSHATFHDYEFDVRRLSARHRRRPVPVVLVVRLHGVLLERVVGNVAPRSTTWSSDRGSIAARLPTRIAAART